MIKVALYASNHGFGHATRVAALAEALNDFDVFTWVCTDRPEYLFANLRPGYHALRSAKLDCGVVHGNNLVPDLEATKQALLKLLHSRMELVAAEVEFLRSQGIDFVISDIPFLSVEAAEYAGIRVFGISNFDWAFIYAELFQDDPTMLPVINAIKALYHRLDAGFLLPFGDYQSVPGFRNPVEIGLLSRRSRHLHQATESMFPNPEQPLLCVLFGGEGDMLIDWEKMCQAWPGQVVSTRQDVSAPNHSYVSPQEDFVGIIQRSWALLSKPGYGSFSEAVQFGTAIIYLPRANYPEEKVLVEGLRGYPAAYQLADTKLSLLQWQKVFSKVLQTGKIAPCPTANHTIAGSIIAAFLKSRYPEDRFLTVCDLGSNNLNMCIYNKSREQVLHKVTLVSGIGKYVRQGRFTTAGLKRAQEQLNSALEIDKCIQSAKHLIATGVFRQVTNADALLSWFRQDYGFKTKIISNKTEAILASLAAENHIDDKESLLITDIGGYSTEFIYKHQGNRIDFSLPLGLLGLNKLSGKRQQAAVNAAIQELKIPYPEGLVTIGLPAALLIKAIDAKADFAIQEVPVAEYTREQLQKLQARLQGSHWPELASVPALETLTRVWLLLLDRFGLDKIMVSTDGISVAYAKRETR